MKDAQRGPDTPLPLSIRDNFQRSLIRSGNIARYLLRHIAIPVTWILTFGNHIRSQGMVGIRTREVLLSVLGQSPPASSGYPGEGRFVVRSEQTQRSTLLLAVTSWSQIVSMDSNLHPPSPKVLNSSFSVGTSTTNGNELYLLIHCQIIPRWRVLEINSF